METVGQLVQVMLSLLLRCDLSTSASLCLQDEPYVFLSREDDDDVRDIGKKRFSFGSTSLCYLMLTVRSQLISFVTQSHSILCSPELSRNQI